MAGVSGDKRHAGTTVHWGPGPWSPRNRACYLCGLERGEIPMGTAAQPRKGGNKTSHGSAARKRYQQSACEVQPSLLANGNRSTKRVCLSLTSEHSNGPVMASDRQDGGS
eukprot:355664-Chlamydomonas_euryale.AAC.12